MEEIQQDGCLLTYESALPLGRPKKILHVNGVASDAATQLRDLEALVWLTLEQPFDVVGIHNSTQGVRADLTESLLGKAELYRFWPEHQTNSSKQRLKQYAELLRSLCDQSLAPEVDILKQVKTQSGGLSLDIDLIRRLGNLPNVGWDELENTLYGTYPAGAPRPTLRLAYEVVTAIRSGTEVFIVAHSQGLIIAALALHIVQQFFGNYPKWTQLLRLIGYGPAIMFADLPVAVRSQAILLQNREDIVAESFSNLRNMSLWNNVQNQALKMIEHADKLMQLIGTDSHHSASLYLGLTNDPVGKRSAELIQQLLLGNWQTNPLIHSLRANRIILETEPLG